MSVSASLRDDWEYVPPKRETNWTLPQPKDERTSRLSSTAPRPTNDVSDIAGTSTGTTSLYRSTHFTRKPWLYAPSDIQGAVVKQQIPQEVRRRNDMNLRNDDIEHSFPESKLFSTPRTCDPLFPVYKLPAMKARAPTPPIQRTETLKVRDIEGTHAKSLFRRGEARNPLDYSDVPLSHAGGRAELRKRQTPSKSLVTVDITSQDHRATNRHVSPLEPEYHVASIVAGRTESIGDVTGSHPKVPPPLRHDRPLLSLRSDDIEGCHPGNHVPYPAEGRRRGWKKTCDISDIDTKGKRKP